MKYGLVFGMVLTKNQFFNATFLVFCFARPITLTLRLLTVGKNYGIFGFPKKWSFI